jgi:microcystin-dependent protein
MAYQIRFTDQINNQPLLVDDNTTNAVTDLNFPGRNTTGYGQAIGENFLHLLENFANTNAPAKPVKGQLWFDTNAGNKQLNVYDGTQWVAAGGLKKSSGQQPDAANSLPGDLWVNTDTQQLYLFSGSGWILVGPRFSAGARTGAEPETIRDTANIERTVVSNYVGGFRVAIFSTVRFQPKATIDGFPTIYPGVTLNASYNGYFGTAEKASKLIVSGYLSAGLEADNFLRADVITNNFKGLNVKSNTGIQVGEDGQLAFSIDNGVGVIYQKTSGSSLDIRVNNNGSERIVVRVDSQERVGINNVAPQEALDVTGNIRVGLTDDNPDTSGRMTLLGTEESNSIVTGTLVVSGGAGFGKSLNIGGDTTLDGTLTVGVKILPQANNGASIGSNPASLNGAQFSEIWANKIYATTDFNGTLTGNVRGSVDGSATNLASSTIFEMDGDVTSNAIEFDGRVSTETVITIAASGNGQIARLDFNQREIAPFPPGTVVIVNNISPTSYRGPNGVSSQHLVIEGTQTYITYASTATGAQAIPGQITAVATGNRKLFFTSLSETFIRNKPEILNPIDTTLGLSETDEFLVSKGQQGLHKIKKNALFQAIPQLPVGVIMPYAGLTPPMGWLLCDGSEVPRIRYEALHAVIKDLYGNSNAFSEAVVSGNAQAGSTFLVVSSIASIIPGQIVIGPGITGQVSVVSISGTTVTLTRAFASAASGSYIFTTNPLGTRGIDTFKLPDLRGRFALGADNMYNGIKVFDRNAANTKIDTIDSNGAGRVIDENASINYNDPTEVRIGSGNEDITLDITNIPDHEHDLRGVNNGQFGAYSDTQLTDGIPVKGLGGPDNAGRLLRTSGGVTGDTFSQPVSIMNPFLAMNYIIWTGKLTDFEE